MSCPPFEARKIIVRSITRILGAGVPCGGGPAANPGEINLVSIAAATGSARAIWVFVVILESCSCCEVEKLRPIVIGLEERRADVDLQRSKRRLPADRQPGRSAQSEIVPDRVCGAGLV